jgi:hypothetical protein
LSTRARKYATALEVEAIAVGGSAAGRSPTSQRTPSESMTISSRVLSSTESDAVVARQTEAPVTVMGCDCAALPRRVLVMAAPLHAAVFGK